MAIEVFSEIITWSPICLVWKQLRIHAAGAIETADLPGVSEPACDLVRVAE